MFTETQLASLSLPPLQHRVLSPNPRELSPGSARIACSTQIDSTKNARLLNEEGTENPSPGSAAQLKAKFCDRFAVWIMSWNQVWLWAELGDHSTSPAASFDLGIHFTDQKLCDSRCPFGQIENQKHLLLMFRSHFQIYCWLADFKRVSRSFYFCELDLIGHRWPTVITIWACYPNEILMIILDLKTWKSRLWS
jgi:hypothetical protein